jgi:hypothetical protein
MRWISPVAVAVLLLAAEVVFAQKVNKDLLARAREHMTEYLARVPDYVCEVSIERYEGRRGSGRLPLRDRLRLEIGFVGGRELYSIPGSSEFTDEPTAGLVSTGMMATGSYAQHLLEVFTPGIADFLEAGLADGGGKRQVRLVFRIPRARSYYIINDGRKEGPAGYRGTVLLDAVTLDIDELHVEIDDVPRDIAIERTIETTIYERVRIGERELPLARSTELVLFDRHGRQMRNRLRFDSCRRYGAESTLKFGEKPQDK